MKNKENDLFWKAEGEQGNSGRKGISDELEVETSLSVPENGEKHQNNNVSASSSANSSSFYFIKEIEFRGKLLPILCQNENGPCPLLAICNVLILRQAIHLPRSQEDEFGIKYIIDEVTKETNKAIEHFALIQLVANYILELSSKVLETTSKSETNEFEGESNHDKSSLISDSNHNRHVYLKQQIDDVMRIIPKLQKGLDINVKFDSCSNFEFTEELTVFDCVGINLFHGWVIGELEDGYSTISKLSYNQAIDCILSSSSTSSSISTVKHGSSSTSSIEDSSRSIEDEKNKNAFLVKEWLDATVSQMTYYGFALLRDSQTGIAEHELCVLFRNNHFSTVFKHNGILYILITDQGYAQVSEVTWERIDTIEGNNVLVNSNFEVISKIASQDHRHNLSPEPFPEENLTEEEALAFALSASLKVNDLDSNLNTGNNLPLKNFQTDASDDLREQSETELSEKQNVKNQHEVSGNIPEILDREYTDEEVALQLQMEEEYMNKKENDVQIQRIQKQKIRDTSRREAFGSDFRRTEEKRRRSKTELKDKEREEAASSSSCTMM